MPKHSAYADEGTDPGISGGFDDDGIEEIPASELGGGGGGVVLGDPSALGGGAEKTRVANLNDLAPPAPQANLGADPTMPGQDADKTMITMNPALAEGAAKKVRGKLTIVAGKEEGKVIEVEDGSQTMGRSREADICLLDIQVSRKHCEFVGDSNGVLLRDLGSGNGTLVNGKPTEETRLVHGDEVEIGDHVLRFEEDGPIATSLAPALSHQKPSGGRAPAALSQRPIAGGAPVSSVIASRRSRRKSGGGSSKKKLILVAGIAGIVVLGVAIKSMGSHPAGPGQVAGPSGKMLAKKVFREGLDLFKNNKFKEAIEKFEQVLAANPRHRKAKKYIDAAKRDMAAVAAIGEAQRLLRANDFAGARAAYGRVQADSLKIDIATRGLEIVKKAEAGKAVEQGEAALAVGSLEDARAAFDRALLVVPDFPDALLGLDKVNARHQNKVAIEIRDAANNAHTKHQQAIAAAARAKAAIAAALRPGQQAFDKREFNRALSLFEALARTSSNPKVRKLAAKKASALKAFKAPYDRGMKAVKTRKSSDAVKLLDVALQKSTKISKSGSVSNQIKKELSGMLYLQGRVAFNADRYGEAYRAWSKALRINPSQNYARDGLKDLKTKGKQLYLEGYTQVVLNRAAAIRKFKLVVSMTPANFEFHGKAKRKLEGLSN